MQKAVNVAWLDAVEVEVLKEREEDVEENWMKDDEQWRIESVAKSYEMERIIEDRDRVTN